MSAEHRSSARPDATVLLTPAGYIASERTVGADEARVRGRSRRRASAGARERPLGALPWIILAAAAGVAAASLADALSRSGHSGGSVVLWLAVSLIILPAAYRLAGREAASGERAATVIVVGLALFCVKVLRDPFGFTYADELVHLHNLQLILSSGSLFGGNSILPITPRYPGLETLGAAVARAGGVSPFAAGVIEVAAARVTMMLALYLFYERFSGSRRAAGLGALIYTSTPNFLFFSAQYSYESLALPLAIVAIYSLIRAGGAPDASSRRSWTAIVVLIAATVIVTHHVTAYALVVFLVAFCLLYGWLRGRRGAPWAVTAFVAVGTAGWLAFAAGGTIKYLNPVVSGAVDKLLQTLSGDASTRVLFANQGGAAQTPLPEEAVAIIGILLLGLGVLAGLRLVWIRWRRNSLLLLLALAAVCYIATLPLRLIPAAWESAARAGEFLFVGVGLMVALGVVWLLERRGGGDRRGRHVLLACALGVVFASGVIAGWPSSERLAEPLRVQADGHTLEPPGYAAALWSGAALGGGQRVAAEDSDARLFIDYGHQVAFTGINPDVDDVLSSTQKLQPWERRLLRRYRITLVETDLRNVSTDIIAGYFFDVGPPSLMAVASSNKFDLANVDRIYDSGNIVIYAVRELW